MSQSQTRFLVISLACSLLFGTVGCQQTQLDQDSPSLQQEGEGKSGNLSNAKPGTDPDGTLAAGPVLEFPHSSSFKTTRQHGVVANAKGANSCFTCHRKDQPTSTSGGKTYKNCMSCHADFPHPSGFKKVHAAKGLASGNTCAVCHAESAGMVNGVRKVPSCSTCHAGYPHSDNFSDPVVHGAAYLDNSNPCLICHQEKTHTVAGREIYSCSECHMGMPHPRGFDDPSSHGSAYGSNKNACAGCHNKEDGARIPNCSTCHLGFPHESAFSTPGIHGNAFLSDKGSCIRCHGGDLTGAGKPDKSCIGCHKKKTPASHSEVFEKTAKHGVEYLANKDLCMSCHDQVKPGMTAPTGKVSCAKCHDTYPHVDFQSGITHGAAYFANPADCVTCHGSDSKGRGNAPACLGCHLFPHPDRFGEPASHGKSFMTERSPVPKGQAALPVKCETCHFKKQKSEGPTFKERYPDKFVACDTCHHFHLEPGFSATVPAGMNSHIFFARQPASACTACHKNFKEHMPHQKDQGCYKCHNGKILNISWRDAGKELAPKPSGKRPPGATGTGSSNKSGDFQFPWTLDQFVPK